MSGKLGMLQDTPEDGFQWASPDAGMTLRGNKTLRSPYPAESRPIPETQTPRVGSDDETVAPDGSESPSPPPIATDTGKWKFPYMNATHQRLIMQRVVPLVQLKQAHVPEHGAAIQSWEAIFKQCIRLWPHLFGGLTGQPANCGKTLRKAFHGYIEAWSKADKKGRTASGVSEQFGGLESTLQTLHGEMEAAKKCSAVNTADKKRKAEQDRIEIDVARSIRERAVGRAEPVEMDEDAEPFESRRATEVLNQIEAAGGDVVVAGTRMAKTVSAPRNVRGPGKKTKTDQDATMAPFLEMVKAKAEAELKMHEDRMQFERESKAAEVELNKMKAETMRKAEENRAQEIELAKMKLQLEMQQLEYQRSMMARNES